MDERKEQWRRRRTSASDGSLMAFDPRRYTTTRGMTRKTVKRLLRLVCQGRRAVVGGKVIITSRSAHSSARSCRRARERHKLQGTGPRSTGFAGRAHGAHSLLGDALEEDPEVQDRHGAQRDAQQQQRQLRAHGRRVAPLLVFELRSAHPPHRRADARRAVLLQEPERRRARRPARWLLLLPEADDPRRLDVLV